MFRGELAWASNFAQPDQPFFIEGLAQPAATAEHGFNALKTLDRDEQGWVLTAASPREAKRRGRRVSLQANWDSVRIDAMRAALAGKFSIPAYRVLLLAVAPELLVEDNTWHDQFWGNCICPRHRTAPGVNMLGQLLRELKTKL